MSSELSARCPLPAAHCPLRNRTIVYRSAAFEFLAELPKTPTGKVKKRALT